MPKAIKEAGLADQVADLENIAGLILKNLKY
jgi:chemotaxis response regulator CheB